MLMILSQSDPRIRDIPTVSGSNPAAQTTTQPGQHHSPSSILGSNFAQDPSLPPFTPAAGNAGAAGGSRSEAGPEKPGKKKPKSKLEFLRKK